MYKAIKLAKQVGRPQILKYKENCIVASFLHHNRIYRIGVAYSASVYADFLSSLQVSMHVGMTVPRAVLAVYSSPSPLLGSRDELKHMVIICNIGIVWLSLQSVRSVVCTCKADSKARRQAVESKRRLQFGNTSAAPWPEETVAEIEL